MTFTTPTFLIFLIIMFSCYWRLSHQGQNTFLILAGLIFYGWWDWRFVPLLIFTAGLDYTVGLLLHRTSHSVHRKALVWLSAVSNFSVLGFFKYFNFFAKSSQQLMNVFGLDFHLTYLQVVLPVGLSFYTFQSFGYVIDVYRGRVTASQKIRDYLGFASFFPQLVAGPIERATNLLRQFQATRSFDFDQARDGLRQMLWGFFIKMVVADNLAPIVNAAYGNVSGTDGWNLLIATYCFAVQIYCDFAGYTHIAIGCARIFGFNLARNFATPYFSQTIPEFWGRWHISLSSWFRDYLYIPLGGNRVSRVRQWFNIAVVFLVSGLWHGANWTFVVWGGVHGFFYLVFHWLIPGSQKNATLPFEPKTWRARCLGFLNIILTFHISCLAWIFFRAASFREAGQIIFKIGASLFSDTLKFQANYVLTLTLFMFLVEWIQRRHVHPLVLDRIPRQARWFVYYLLVVLILIYMPMKSSPFIYFQF